MPRVSAGIQYEPRGTSLYYFGGALFQTNTYPDETELSVNRQYNRRREDLIGSGYRRRDTITSLDLGAGLRFSEMASLELTVSNRDRDSNLDPMVFERVRVDGAYQTELIKRSLDRLDYDDLTIGLTFRYGFTPQRNYI